MFTHLYSVCRREASEGSCWLSMEKTREGKCICIAPFKKKAIQSAVHKSLSNKSSYKKP